jgi:hypothetical protein
MLNFLKSLLGMSDRATITADRAAAAIEGLADDLETVRASVRQRLGLVAPPPVQFMTTAPAVPVPADTNGTASEPPVESNNTNGRKRGAGGRFVAAS